MGGCDQSGREIEQGRFAAAAGADYGDKFPGGDFKVDAVDGGVGAENAGDIFEGDGGRQKASLIETARLTHFCLRLSLGQPDDIQELQVPKG